MESCLTIADIGWGIFGGLGLLLAAYLVAGIVLTVTRSIT